MRWNRARRSSNVEDRRGRGGGRMPLGGGKGLGLGGIVILIIIGLVMGKNPLEMLALVGEMGGQGAAPQSAGVPATSDDPAVDFVRAILGETEDTWTALYAERNQRYQPPRLVLFSNGVNSACGFASAAVGPFYCPGDRQVYLDLGFFHELATRFGAAGDFAQAYVIAHEVGHHIQTLSGVSARVQSARQRGEQVEGANGLLVRQELQEPVERSQAPVRLRLLPLPVLPQLLADPSR